MKVLVIMTGGTIGCSEKNNVRSLDTEAGGILFDLFKKTPEYDSTDEYDIISPLSILSENLSAKALNTLTSEIRSRIEAVDHDYDGIIVTHGSDTIQYTAAALSYAFGADSLPIMVVASSHPIDNPKANGLTNFCAAVSSIRNGIRGVYVPYRNKQSGPVQIHSAHKLLSHCESMHELFSLDADIAAPAGETFALGENSQILTVSPSPGACYSFGDLSDYKCVLFDPYHSATLNTASAEFIAFCRKAKAAGLRLYLSSVRDDAVYESTSVYDELGIQIISAPFVSAYMRLWIDNSKA